MRTIVVAALFLLAGTPLASAANCAQSTMNDYAKAPGPRALVGNSIGCTFWGGGFPTKKAVENAALAKCKKDSGKPCSVIKSSDAGSATAASAPNCSDSAERSYKNGQRPKVLVGNGLGCTWAAAGISLSAVTDWALAKCRHDSGAACHVIKSAK
jgi:hypothetical protein